MKNKCREIVKLLRDKNKTIALMESCTGGFITNEITNISGASKVLKVSAVTYSNEFKIKFGVNKKTIDTYSVYSLETANEMARNISAFSQSNIGIGITGELGNTTNTEPKVYYSIYLANEDKYINNIINIEINERKKMKEDVANRILTDLLGGII